jgi:uncharacterized protein
MAPIGSTERVEAIDILRGLALFGILAANIRGFAGPAIAYFEPARMWPGFPDRLAQALVETFIQGKFIALFGLLFGVGFAVQLSRAQARGSRFAGIYVRRLLVLAALGLVHGLLIWWGDILLPYALTGFFLFFFRRRRDRTLLVWATLCYLAPLLLMAGFVVAETVRGPFLPHPSEPTAAVLQEIVRIYGDGSWTEITAQRAREAVRHNWGFVVFAFPNLLGLFLFGMLAWRRRVFDPPDDALPRYARIMRICLIVGVAGNATAVIIRWFVRITPMPPTAIGVGVFGLQLLSTPPLSAAYVCAAVLLARRPRWRDRLVPFAAVGRASLSNYLLQSVVATLLFYSYGLGFYGDFGPAALLLPTVLVYSVEPPLSRWWLERYRFGPVEWLWRSATYGRWQPLRRTCDDALAVGRLDG